MQRANQPRKGLLALAIFAENLVIRFATVERSLEKTQGWESPSSKMRTKLEELVSWKTSYGLQEAQ